MSDTPKVLRGWMRTYADGERIAYVDRPEPYDAGPVHLLERLMNWLRRVLRRLMPVHCPQCRIPMYKQDGNRVCGCGIVADVAAGTWRYSREWGFSHTLGAIYDD